MKKETNKKKETVNVKLDHEYVDLGLPSGTLWATCNIGTENPEDTGLYFQWGDTQGYTAEQVGKDKIFEWAHYKYSNAGSSSDMTKYNSTDKLTVLLSEDDAATANWGSNWRMPTVEEVQELIDNTTHELDTVNVISGMRLTSSNGNSIFVPFAGCADGSNVYGVGGGGSCWSSSLFSGNVNYALRLFVNYKGDAVTNYGSRYCGFCVRPVYKDKIQIVDGFNQYAINFPE